MCKDMNDIDSILKLYEVYSNNLQKYTTIIWQFPTALITVNILAVNFFIDEPCPLLFISVLNFVLIYALFRHVDHQRSIIDSLKKIENKLRKDYKAKDMIPNFKEYKIKAASLLAKVLLILNIVFFLCALGKIVLPSILANLCNTLCN